MVLINIHFLITATTDPLERIKRTKHNVKTLNSLNGLMVHLNNGPT